MQELEYKMYLVSFHFHAAGGIFSKFGKVLFCQVLGLLVDLNLQSLIVGRHVNSSRRCIDTKGLMAKVCIRHLFIDEGLIIHLLLHLFSRLLEHLLLHACIVLVSRLLLLLQLLLEEFTVFTLALSALD